MSDSSNKPGTENTEAPSATAQTRGSGPDATRRRLIRGAAAAPVIMTLASRPVWGSQGRCSLSGDIFSANVSNIDHECTAGQGCTPGYWRNNYRGWDCTPFSPGHCMEWRGNNCRMLDATQGAGATTFHDVFGYSPRCGGAVTLMEVLQTCPGSLDWHAVGAALNASCSMIYYGATLAEVVDAYHMARTGQTDEELLKDVFDNMNNRGCPIDAHGNCEKNHTKNELGQCIPVKTGMDHG